MLTTSLRAPIACGSHSRDVQHLQIMLNRFYGNLLDVHGRFGPDTEIQVKRFQAACNLFADGIVSEQTWYFLEAITPYTNPPHRRLSYGSHGNEVKYLQARLNHYQGTRQPVDGLFSAMTEIQVMQLQAQLRITIDGIVGYHTWSYLDQP